MFIYFDSDSDLDEGLADLMQQAAVLCAREEGLDPSRLSMSVSFVDSSEIRRLNREYRKTDEVTDVLSFPQFDGFAYLTDAGEISLGDVVICRKRAEQQAAEYGHSLQRELLYLFTHSVYHLLGYDHIEDEDKRTMRAKEEIVLAEMALQRRETGGDNVG
ncbi:MAG: rRNA maturation RNase YbeY [Bacillota bacterium]|jgi:probable rRNA maturation factor|nr:rRNA maturation RNase YbeY [Eubacteriales bacterium]MDI9492415.1 rRNA maturation RNase YbeY [Bacillota bacterium]NLV70331.1 rRNA maturation RNase YbeY [Clostridiales bacterium]MDD3536792.1 rRNA maturation RNase YbeY [Eubacteriales bacterium]MDD4286535.1 rRNA maturation RNase YbeY [Eubacteriales bacterium]